MESEKDCSQFREAMLEVLYEEATEPTERAVRDHCEACPSCREELAGFKVVRRSLASWTLPARLRLGRPVRPQLLERRWLAAAAVVLLALGASLGLSGSELRYQNGSFAFRLGRGQDVSRLLAQQEERYQRQLQELRATPLPVAATAAPDSPREEALLRRIRQLIEEGERRQARALDMRLADFRRQSDAQRRYDLAQVGASLSYLEGKTGLQMAKNTELMGQVIQASQKR